MTHDPLYTRMRELSWRRKLTEAEEQELRAWLVEHADAQADWEAEAGLNQALDRLPNVPVASNFTARVMQAVEREAAQELPPAAAWRWWRRWLPRVAFLSVILGSGLLVYHQVQTARRVEYAKSLATVSDVSSMPSPKILEDFDAIRAYKTAPRADKELLALLK